MNLEEAGYHIEFIKPVVDEMAQRKDKFEIFIMYLGSYVEQNSDFIFYVKDICSDEDKLLYLIGYEEEIAKACEVIPITVVNHVFYRPLNVKELVEDLNGQLTKEEMNLRKKHILVVDDSGTMLRTIKSWLSEKYRVSMANSGASAIGFLVNNKPDLIVLDYEMPVCTGPQVMEMIRSEPSISDIPIMFLTGKNDAESVRKVMSLKPQGYMLKNMGSSEVLKTIDDFFLKQKIMNS